MSRLLILDHDAIQLKLERIAWQIAENLYNQENIVILGVKERGCRIASIIHTKLSSITNQKIDLIEVNVDKDKPLDSDIVLNPNTSLTNKSVVLVDDVLNSGITISGIIKHILLQKPKSIKVAVLANRDHKAFPIAADFVGVSLATTLQEHISFVEDHAKMAVYLD